MNDKIMKFEDILESELDKEMDRIIAAKSLNPQDVKTVMDAICLMLKVKEYEEWENEGNSYSYIPMENTYDDGYSMRRGRSSVTGRFVSRDSSPMISNNGYSTRRSYGPRVRYDSGYSGHSIKDRMIDRLESMYDEAKTDHERQIVDEWINRLETNR